MTSLPPREAAWALLCEYTQSDSLRKHALGVEAVMRAYARHYGGDASAGAWLACCMILIMNAIPAWQTIP